MKEKKFDIGCCVFEDECTDYPLKCPGCTHNKMQSYFKPNINHISPPMQYKQHLVRV